jgi:uncharacterized SAM-binding protein YcdF (DUF218 family)
VTLLLCLLLGAAGWAAAALAIDHFGHSRGRPQACDAIVVPGCAVLRDGGPSPPLARRVQRAVDLWRSGVAPRLVLTGGLGEHPPAEARVAADYAQSLGVPSEVLVLEERSHSTEENARFTAARIDARRVAVVTDSYHALRTYLVFRRYFEEVAVAAVSAPATSRLRQALREVPVLAWYALRLRIGPFPRQRS